MLQALLEDPPVHPNDVLREIIDLAQLPVLEDEFGADDSDVSVTELLRYHGDDETGEMPLPDYEFADDISPLAPAYEQGAQQSVGAVDEQGGDSRAAADQSPDAGLGDDIFNTDAFDVDADDSR